MTARETLKQMLRKRKGYGPGFACEIGFTGEQAAAIREVLAALDECERDYPPEPEAGKPDVREALAETGRLRDALWAAGEAVNEAARIVRKVLEQ
jgi:hypothetical protein